MPVEDVFSITGRGTVATGRIETGKCKVGDEVQLLGLGEDKKSVITGVEMFRKTLSEGEAGDNVGLLLRGIDKDERLSVVWLSCTRVLSHRTINQGIYLRAEERKRVAVTLHSRTTTAHSSTSAQWTAQVRSSFLRELEMVMPGDNVEIEVSLIYKVALNEGLRFAIREGGRTVGAGQVTAIWMIFQRLAERKEVISKIAIKISLRIIRCGDFLRV